MNRLASLDAFRGFAIASMVLVNNPGDWNHLYAPLAHAKWHGWTFTDLVFPFFLFTAGVSMAISLERHRLEGAAPRVLMRSVLRRAAVIFAIGLFLNFFPAFDPGTVRIPGVLQRIALCIAIAAPFAIRGGGKEILGGILALLIVYMGLMFFASVPGPDGVVARGSLEPGRDFGAWLDRVAFGNHLWSQSRTWDPEGLVSTLPAAASTLFGVMVGRGFLRSVSVSGLALSGRLIGGGGLLLAAGLLLDAFVMPINKNLWTVSFCVFMTGWSMVVFGAFHAAMDGAASERVRGAAGRLFLPLTIYGMNALFLFALSGLVARILVAAGLKAPLYAPFQAAFTVPENASLAFAVAFNLATFAVAWFLWKKRWFIKV